MENSRLVYSTDQGRICPDCKKSTSVCTCKNKKKEVKKPLSRVDGIVRISREAKGRNGKTVTTITGVPLDGEALQAFSADLKKRCGTGGTVKDGVIIIQGDHREVLSQEIKKKGFPVKLAGG
ncbi:MAG: translation initiation factor Sui1 [Pseudomonadota bacterium]